MTVIDTQGQPPMEDKFKSMPSLTFLIVGAIAAGAAYWIWQQSEVAGATLIIVGVMLMLAQEVSRELKRVETRVCGADDYEYDEGVDEQVSKASEWYREHLKKLETEKKQLPRTDLWEISTNLDWEQYLIEHAESLRGLIAQAYGDTPDTVFVERDVKDVPLDYNLAHALAQFACLQKDLSIKATEWAVKKIEVLGSMRKRRPNLQTIAEDERELREIEREIEKMRERLPALKHNVWEAFRNARGGAVTKRSGA